MSSCLNLNLNYFVIFTVVIGLWSGATNAKFPNDPKPCKYGETDCILKLVNYYMNEMSHGDSSLNLIKIDPLSVSKISIKQGAESPVNIDLTFIKNDINGLSDAQVYKVKGFGQDLTQKHEIRMKIKTVSLVGDYSITGSVLILPIRGNGKSNMTMVNVDMGMHFSGTPYEKDGATYMKITNMKITMEPERLYYQFENLFNGDKTLSDNMNLFLNENWKDIYNEVRISITDAFARIFESVMSNVFSKLPYEKFFAEA